jgi:hypothetical protein
MQFTKAVRKRAKLRLALTGPSGSGKTYGALMLAKGIGGKIAVIDTEHGSASLYSHLVDFDALELAPPYSPERYIEAIRAAEKAGYDVIVVDSTTHEWSGSGGCLEINEKTAHAKFRGNTWSAWNDTTPRHRAFIDAMLQANAHVIATGRSKTETSQVDDGSRKKVVKLGMKTEQRDGFEYEFTVVLDLIHDGHYATASKDRTGLFQGDPAAINAKTGATLREWLESGAEAVPEPVKEDPVAILIDRVIAGDARGVAVDLAKLKQKDLDAVWGKIPPELQDDITAAWPDEVQA